MIKKERYQCEYCGTWHDTEKDAERCERWHSKIERIEVAKYDVDGQFPKTIGVRFDNGTY